MADMWNYSTVPGNNNAAIPNGMPEGMPYNGVNNSWREGEAALRRAYIDPGWFQSSTRTGTATTESLLTLAYVSPTQFTITAAPALDMTTTFEVGRKIRLTGTTPFTVYATITASVFASPVTTVDFVPDSGTVDATLNNVYCGLSIAANPVSSLVTNAKWPELAVPVTRDLASTDARRNLVVDTSGGAVTLTMPVSYPFTDGDTFFVLADGTNNVTVEDGGGPGNDVVVLRGNELLFISTATELRPVGPTSPFGSNVQIITVSGNFVVPAGVSLIDVEVQGGGGGGAPGSGGGGGGYARALIPVTPGNVIPVIIGAGGAPAAAGGTTSFGAFLTATGGLIGTPGIGVGGSLNITGGKGGAATASPQTMNIGGDSMFGFGGRNIAPIASPGTGFGGGGGGQTGSGFGSGTAGICVVRW